MLDFYLLYILIFFLGASFASFLSVFHERGISMGRSFCNNCKRQLFFFELIPVVSYLFLRGKCRKCKFSIPAKYFVGEIILGIWFVVTFSQTLFPLFFVLGSIFYLLSLEDIDSMEVSSRYVHLFFAVGILISLINFYLTQNYYELLFPILIFSPFWIIYFVNKNAIGEADPYVYTALGISFGTQFSISLFMYSVWLGTLYGVFYLLFVNKKIEKGVRIPFLPIIFLSTLLLLIFNYHFIQIKDILVLNEAFSLYSN